MPAKKQFTDSKQYFKNHRASVARGKTYGVTSRGNLSVTLLLHVLDPIRKCQLKMNVIKNKKQCQLFFKEHQKYLQYLYKRYRKKVYT